MYFELQLSAGKFGRILRNRLRAEKLCVFQEIQLTNTSLVVDHVSIGDETQVQREQTLDLEKTIAAGGKTQIWKDHSSQVVWIFSYKNYTSWTVPFLQVRQQLLVHLVEASKLNANGSKATPPWITPSVYAVFNVSLNSRGATGAGGPLKLAYFLSHIDFGAFYSAVPETDRNRIADAIKKTKLEPTILDIGNLSGALNRPVAGINAGISCDVSKTCVALRVDIDLFDSDVAVDAAFFKAGPVNVLDGHDWAMLIDWEILQRDIRKIVKPGLTAGGKSKLYSEPSVTWNAGATAVDIGAELEFFDACPLVGNMDVDVHIRVSFSCPSPNTLRRHIEINGHASDKIEEFACALSGALLWPFVGPVMLQDEDLGDGIGAYAAALAVGPVVRFFGIIAAIETKTLSEDKSKDLGKSCHKQGDSNYECDNVLDLRVPLSPPGESLLELNRVSGLPGGLVLAGFVRSLPERADHHVTVTNTQFLWTIGGNCRAGFRILNQAQIQVSSARDNCICREETKVLDGAEHLYELLIEDELVNVRPMFKPTVATALQPCRVRLVTTGGVRIITLGHPGAITGPEEAKLTKIRDSMRRICIAKANAITKPLEWKITKPGPVERPDIAFWQIVLQNLRPDETVRLERPGGEVLATARASAAGVVHLALMFPHEAAPSQVVVAFSGEPEEDPDSRVDVQQLLYEHRASLPAGGLVRALRFDGTSGVPSLVVESDTGESSWDVSVPGAPVLLRSEGVVREPERDLVLLHTGKQLESRRIDELEQHLARLRDRYGEPEALGRPRVGGVAEALYVRTRQGAMLFDLRRLGDAEPVHTYVDPAWFEGTSVRWNLMARHDAERGMVDLYRVTATESI